WFFFGQLWDAYVPLPFGTDPSAAPLPLPPPPRPGQSRLDRDEFPYEANGVPLLLIRVRNPDELPTKGPVLLIAGTSVPFNIFEAPISKSIVERLVEEGYEVWMQSWRASANSTPSQFALDDAGIDHIRAVEVVLENSGAEQLKAVVHCQ